VHMLNVFLYFGRIHWMAISSARKGQLQRLGRGSPCNIGKCVDTIVYVI